MPQLATRTALLVLAAIGFAAAGCGKPSAENRLVGTWDFVVDISPDDMAEFVRKKNGGADLPPEVMTQIRQRVAAEYPKVHGTLVFQKDGTYTMRTLPLTNSEGVQTVKERVVNGKWAVVTQLENNAVVRLMPSGDDPNARETEVAHTFLNDNEIDFPFHQNTKEGDLKLKAKLVRQKSR